MSQGLSDCSPCSENDLSHHLSRHRRVERGGRPGLRGSRFDRRPPGLAAELRRLGVAPAIIDRIPRGRTPPGPTWCTPAPWRSSPRSASPRNSSPRASLSRCSATATPTSPPSTSRASRVPSRSRSCAPGPDRGAPPGRAGGARRGGGASRRAARGHDRGRQDRGDGRGRGADAPCVRALARRLRVRPQA